jgi:hypothetical protein
LLRAVQCTLFLHVTIVACSAVHDTCCVQCVLFVVINESECAIKFNIAGQWTLCLKSSTALRNCACNVRPSKVNMPSSRVSMMVAAACLSAQHWCICVGLARTIYIRCVYGIFGREFTIYTVIYSVYIRFWPTLHMCVQCATMNMLAPESSSPKRLFPSIRIALVHMCTCKQICRKKTNYIGDALPNPAARHVAYG